MAKCLRHDTPRLVTGNRVTPLAEAVNLFSSPISLILLIGTAIAIRMRNPSGALATLFAWTVWISLIAMVHPTGTRAIALTEGCIGSPALFIALVAAICTGTILYTAPLRRRD